MCVGLHPPLHVSPATHTNQKKQQKTAHAHNMAYLCNYSSFASLITPPHTSFCPPHVFLFFPLASLFPLSAPFPPHRHIPLSSPLLSPSSSETRTPPPRPPEASKDFSDNYGKSGFPETGKWPRKSSPRLLLPFIYGPRLRILGVRCWLAKLIDGGTRSHALED